MTPSVSPRAADVAGTRRTRAPVAGICGLYAALLLTALLVPEWQFGAVVAGLGLFGLLALIFSVRAATRRALPVSARRAWWLLSAGVLLLNLVPVGIAVSGGTVDTARGIAAPPSLGDLFRMMAVVPLLAALLRFPRSQATRRDGHKMALDVVTVVGGSFMLIWYYVLGPVVMSDLPVLTLVVAAAYPIGDLVLIFGATVVLLRGAHVATRRPMVVLVVGLSLLVVSDTYLSYRKLHPDIDSSPVLQLAVMMTGLMLFAVAAAEQCRSAADDRALDGHRLTPTVTRLPFAALAAGSVLLIVVSLRSGPYPWFGLICGAVVMTAAVAARQSIAMRENHDLIISDSLTGLVNRVHLQDRLGRAVDRANRTGERVAVLLLDLNGFKQINDTLGHDAGDQLLVGFARLLKDSVLGADVVARLGGDEFAIVLHDVGHPDNAGAVASRIIAGLAEPVAVNGEPVFPSASIGVATSEPGCVVQPAELLHRADMAMYRAKSEPGNNYRFHAADLARATSSAARRPPTGRS